MDPNLWWIRMTMRVPSFYEEYQIFNFTLYSMNNNDEMCYLWTIRPDISKEGIHVLVEFESLQSQTFLEVQHAHEIKKRTLQAPKTVLWSSVQVEEFKEANLGSFGASKSKE
ncbi:hypothetical protein M9H77_27367 [Catharanthus roseus]|uniref:Uncharacterized protein n=1 Tax=Catharanthus roseus TaxID=4058 RepID=A0ACC0AEG0_CATRO|nr:hypothetical protein M9H77_27367 [Catharanthus roseus]